MENMKESEEEIREKTTKKQVAKHWDEFDKKNNNKIIIIISIIIIILMVLSTGFALININNENIIKGISIDGIKVQNLSKEEATKLINDKIEEKINNEIKIYVDDEEQTLLLSQIELIYNTEKAVENAYKIGRQKNIFVNNFEILKSKLFGNNMDLEFSYNEELLNNVIQGIKNNIPNAVINPTYCIEDNELIITKGTEGLTINKDELKDKIIEKFKLDSDANIAISTYMVKPEEIDIEEIHDEVYKEVQDAYYTTEPFQIYPEVKGVDFNLDEAKELLKEDKEEYIIALIVTEPQKTTSDIGTEAFPDRISIFQTRYDATNRTRTTNLQLAVNKINGVVLMPGETFSYNKTLGKRTAEAGYKDAAGYSGGKVVQMIGGGICQISSTLYDAVVYANLEIVERHNHAFLTSYVGAGKDATVVYGSLDFQFKNTREYPIKIVSYMQNGIATVCIYGIKEENEYDVEISTTILNYIPYEVVYENDASLTAGTEVVSQGGQRGCKSITYKILKQNGKEISRSVLSTDTYSAMNKYIKKGTKGAGTVSAPVTTPEPETTNEPETPVEPEIPEEPANPTEPEIPTMPAEPEQLETPITPETPGNSGETEQAA